MIVSFTGTSRGMTAEQKVALGRLLAELRPSEVHHGDCIGADIEFAEIASGLSSQPKIVSHPGAKNLTGSPHNDQVLAAKTDFARNRDLIDLLGADDVLLVAPFDPQPATLGGVAYTTTYCQKRAKRFVVVWPDGHLGEEWRVSE
jgi:hypothetical protein